MASLSLGHDESCPLTLQDSELIKCVWAGTWHPLGRVTGGTLYPGLMVTSGVIYHVLRLLSLPVDIRNICVLLAPAFSGLTAFASYLITSEMTTSPSAGLLAAAFMGITPGYISRSVAGSYDNEAIAIFLLVFTFFLWIKSVKNGSAMWAALTALFYGYMVSAWGGYVFITNLLPLHAFVLICMGRYSPRLYVSYSTWFALGTLASMQIPFVGFLPVRSSEHMSALGKLRSATLALRLLNNPRCIRSSSAGSLCGIRPPTSSEPAIPDTAPKPCAAGFLSLCGWFGLAHRFRGDCTMERSVLLAVGHGLREDPHPYYCISIRAPADRVAGLLLRPELVDMAFPRWSIHVLPTSQGRTCLCRHLRCASELFRWGHGPSDADLDSSGLHCSSFGAVQHLGYIPSRREAFRGRSSEWTSNRGRLRIRHGADARLIKIQPRTSQRNLFVYLESINCFIDYYLPTSIRASLHLGHVQRVLVAFGCSRQPASRW